MEEVKLTTEVTPKKTTPRKVNPLNKDGFKKGQAISQDDYFKHIAKLNAKK